MRVIRKFDNADELIQSFLDWERSTLSQDVTSSLTSQEQLRLLDFPDFETQAANIARSSTLGKEDLLKRAAETPSQLSVTEVTLLKDRYWLDISAEEEHKISLATGLIMGPLRVSEEEYENAERRLRAARHPLYAENEEEAIEKAIAEHWRRENNAWRERQRQETERALLARAAPWVRRLWEEDKGEKLWGYGIFVAPGTFVDDEEAERYMTRRDGVLFHARGAIGAGSSAISNMWKLKRLDWPTIAKADTDGKEGSSQIIQESDGKDESSTSTIDTVRAEKERIEQEESDEKRAAIFQELREQFKSIRNQAPQREKIKENASNASTKSEGGSFQDGILQNVFLMIDKNSVGSVLSGHGLVDDMWIWAIDPDHNSANDASAAAATSEGPRSIGTPPSGYKGFIRVRLQQLVHNFYDARRFHGRDYPMRKLWEAAQKSKHRAFVSLKDDEARSWSIDRFVGSAMRAQPPRIVYGPKTGNHVRGDQSSNSS